MRSYDIAIASLALDAPVKWTDNVLTQHVIPDVVSLRRGVARRISYDAVLRLAAVRLLHVGLGLGVPAALAIAQELLSAQAPNVLRVGHVAITLDLAALEADLNVRLADALEQAPRRRRGRPPRRR